MSRKTSRGGMRRSQERLAISCKINQSFVLRLQGEEKTSSRRKKSTAKGGGARESRGAVAHPVSCGGSEVWDSNKEVGGGGSLKNL